jgi:nucleoside-diphosphate-sugar epimerase
VKIVIPGGTGKVGTILSRAFHGDGHDVVVLSRRAQLKPWRVARWDGVRAGDWFSEIDGADVVTPDAASTAGTTPRIVPRFGNPACSPPVDAQSHDALGHDHESG